MTYKNVPDYGEPFAPGVLKTKKVSFGFSSDNDVRITTTGVYPIFEVQPGVAVVDMLVVKKTAFNSTGAFVMNIGDTDADGFWPSTDLIASDAGVRSLLNWQISTGALPPIPAYKAAMRLYTSDDDGTIAVTLTVAKLSAGQAEAYLTYIDTLNP